MSVIDFHQAKMIKALQEHGHKVNRKEVEFLDIPEELKEVGVDAVMSTNGVGLTEDDVTAIIKFVSKEK